MSSKKTSENNIVVDLYTSFRAMPTWIQGWMLLLLMPINIVSLFFLNEPMGMTVAFLANIGMLLNLPVMLYDRGFSKLMSIPHLLPWTALVALILFQRPEGSSTYDVYLTALMVINSISLFFDYPDAIKWLKGDRAVAGEAS